MRELRRRLRLLIEPANELGIGRILLAKDLYRNPPAQQNIRTAVDDRHAAFAELSVETVSVIEYPLLDQFPVFSSAVLSTARASGAA